MNRAFWVHIMSKIFYFPLLESPIWLLWSHVNPWKDIYLVNSSYFSYKYTVTNTVTWCPLFFLQYFTWENWCSEESTVIHITAAHWSFWCYERCHRNNFWVQRRDVKLKAKSHGFFCLCFLHGNSDMTPVGDNVTVTYQILIGLYQIYALSCFIHGGLKN